jgi:peptide/nickel transport system ATP-binding protein/oligopeptide transport system ATP-binding protein
VTPLLEAVALRKSYHGGAVRAVDGVALRIGAGETLGLVGESGCGKSTLAQIVLGLVAPDEGEIWFEGENLLTLRPDRLRKVRGRIQFVPQNPKSSLNPRASVRSSIEFNLRAQQWSPHSFSARVPEMLELVGLSPALADRYPHQLSGGQIQRVAIARALSTKPSLVICDEAVSALDKSVQAQILNLLTTVQAETDIACIFISHDMAAVEHLSHRVAVMYLGKIVEWGTNASVMDDAQHPYTKALLSAVPGRKRSRTVLAGDPLPPDTTTPCCNFFPRCPEVLPSCATTAPTLRLVRDAHAVSCLLHDEGAAV